MEEVVRGHHSPRVAARECNEIGSHNKRVKTARGALAINKLDDARSALVSNEADAAGAGGTARTAATAAITIHIPLRPIPLFVSAFGGRGFRRNQGYFPAEHGSFPAQRDDSCWLGAGATPGGEPHPGAK